MASKRIVVYGSSGSGKSSLAADVARQAGLPHVEIDTLAFDSRYTHVPFDVLWERFRRALSGGGWVVEGMHRDQLEEALRTADTFVWLDVPRAVVAWRLSHMNLSLVLKRQERHGRRLRLRDLVRDELPFIHKTIRKHPQRRAHGLRFFEEASSKGLRVVRIRTKRDVGAFLNSFQ